MNRLGLVALSLVALGVGGLAQCCAPCVAPAPEPPCYTAFWQGEDICFELVVPWSWFGCCCPPTVQVTAWRVETLEGALVFQQSFPSPVAPGKWVWKQVDALGNPVAPGFYRIIVTATTGEFVNTVKIVARPECQPCCFFPFFLFGCWNLSSKPCTFSWCAPYVKLYRCPTCALPCLAPCGLTIFLGPSEP